MNEASKKTMNVKDERRMGKTSVAVRRISLLASQCMLQRDGTGTWPGKPRWAADLSREWETGSSVRD
jgi:hypothetical protein